MRALVLLMLAGAAWADDAAVLRCRQTTDAAQRLACYDAIVVAATPGAKPQETPAQFGISRADQQVSLDAISSRIDGPFEGWGPKQRIRLANGQVWQISDDSSAVMNLKSPGARIKRGMMGSYILELEGTNHTARVRRVE